PFYDSSAPRHLHSFPTRRSSDLGPGSIELTAPDLISAPTARRITKATVTPPASSDARRRHTANVRRGRHGGCCKPQEPSPPGPRSEEHTSELQSRSDLVCRLLLE